jgi:hypothetical protein
MSTQDRASLRQARPPGIANMVHPPSLTTRIIHRRPPHIPPELPLETPRCCPMPSTTHQSWYSLEKRDNPHDTGVIPEDEIARLHQLDRAHVFRLTAVVEHALELGLT